MKPDIVIGTASRILEHMRARTIDVSSSLQWLVIDEADLLFTYGYEKNLKTLLSHFNNTYQAILMSATFTEVGCKLIELETQSIVLFFELDKNRQGRPGRVATFFAKS